MTVSPENNLDDLLGPEPKKRPPRGPFQNWTDDELDAEPDYGFLIGSEDKPVLQENALWQVFGKMKSAKTLFCLEMAFCVAFGIPFHGLPVKQGQIVYILAEGGAKRNYRRVKALWFKHEDAMRAKGFTSLKDAREKTGNFIYTDDTIKLADSQPADKTSPESFLKIMREQGVTKPMLIVLDTWQRALAESGGSSGSAEHVGPSLVSCDLIRKEMGGCTLIMVAHAGKNTVGAKGLTEPMDVSDGVWECIKSEKLGRGPLAVFTFRGIIIRHGAEGFVLTCNVRKQFEEAPSVILVSSGVGASGLEGASDAERAWLAALVALPGGSGALLAWRKAGVAAGVVKGIDDLPPEPDTVRKSFKRAREELVRRKAVRLIDGIATATPAEAMADSDDDGGGDFEVGGED